MINRNMARKHISTHEIQAALEQTGGAVAAAAKILGVSRSTLHRRLRENPGLRPRPENRVWEQALNRTFAMQEEADASLFSPNVGAWSRLYRHIDWDETSAGLDPEVLHPAERFELWKKLYRNEHKFRVTPTKEICALRSAQARNRR